MSATVDSFFNEYARRYTERDVEGVTNLCHWPFLAIRKGETIHLPDRAAVRDHFFSAINAYRFAAGAGTWTPVESTLAKSASTPSQTQSISTTIGAYGEQQFGWHDRFFVSAGLRVDNNSAFGDKLRPIPPVTPSEDYSEFINAGVPSMFFRIGVYEPERVAAAREGEGPQLPSNHSPLFAPVPKPTIETGITAMTLAVLGVFDQKARHK